MEAAEIVRAFITALEAQRWDEAASYLADDFIFRGYGAPGQVADKRTFLSLQRALQEAAPDWKFDPHIEWARGNAVAGTVHIGGTHTREFVPPPGDLQPVPASGTRFELPREDAKFHLQGSTIAALTITLPPGSPTPVLFGSAATSGRAHLTLQSTGKRGPVREPPHIADIVRIAAFPVFGIAGNPLGLTLRGVGMCHFGPRPPDGLPTSVSQVGLSFDSPLGARPPTRQVIVTSTGKDAPITAPPDWRASPTGEEIVDADGCHFARFATLEAFNRARESAQEVPRHVLIDGFALAGEEYGLRIQCWERPHPEQTFTLLGAWGRIGERASGVASEELLTIIEALVPINDRPDLVAQYQVEADAWRRFFLGGQTS